MDGMRAREEPPRAVAPGHRTLRLTVSYDGTAFAGWQLQPGQRTVQGVLEGALFRLLGVHVRANAAGRTDSGVHAEGQVVGLAIPPGRQLPERAFTQGLNGLLPEDAAVIEARWAPPGFDPRRSSLGKLYRYRILNGPARSPLRRHTHWLLYAPLDLEAMQAAAALLLGEHDFAAFRAANCPARTTVRRLDRLSVEPGGPREIVVEVCGTAFLKHMVRNLVGTLVEVGRGQRAAAQVATLLACRDRRLAGPTAPPHGLCLVEVYYPPW